MKQTAKLTKAFSLVEILLLVVVLGVIAVIVISSYQLTESKHKNDLTAQEIRYLLDAASEYYLTYNKWPAEQNETSIMPEDFLPFLPRPEQSTTRTLLNPWGKQYSIDGSPRARDRFEVSTVAPSRVVGQELARRLPYGKFDVSTLKVTAAVNPPGQYEQAQSVYGNYIVKDIGRATSKQFNKAANCPRGWLPLIATGFNRIPNATIEGLYYPIYKLNIVNQRDATNVGFTVTYNTLLDKGTKTMEYAINANPTIGYVIYCVKDLK